MVGSGVALVGPAAHGSLASRDAVQPVHGGAAAHGPCRCHLVVAAGPGGSHPAAFTAIDACPQVHPSRRGHGRDQRPGRRRLRRAQGRRPRPHPRRGTARSRSQSWSRRRRSRHPAPLHPPPPGSGQGSAEDAPGWRTGPSRCQRGSPAPPPKSCSGQQPRAPPWPWWSCRQPSSWPLHRPWQHGRPLPLAGSRQQPPPW